MGGTAASAGYMIAVPAARIFARDSTLTGSIGVLLETGEVSGLLDTLGITAETIVSGPLKDQPSFTQPLTSPQGRDGAAGAGDGHVRPVRRHGRHRPAHGRPSRCARWPTGAPIPGGRRSSLGLIDAIGGEPEARAWLAAEKGIPDSLPVEDVEPAAWPERACWRARSAPVAGGLMKTVLSQGLMLDGAWAVWQPAGRQ